ncbi:MAG: hypothetical protein QOE70_4944 [Chthoniobacter sp.]|jgi:hypothetical protein|nr:hypothetical protein [Chthoniobacter sp.]
MSEQSQRIVITRDGQEFGPYSADEVNGYLAAGRLLPSDLAKPEGADSWRTLSTLPGVDIPSSPPPLPPNFASAPPAQLLGDDPGIRLLLPVGRSGWAIAAGYLGLFSLIVVPAPLALIISVIAIRDIRRSKASPHPKYGMGRAIFGLVMGILGTALIAFFLVVAALSHWK